MSGVLYRAPHPHVHDLPRDDRGQVPYSLPVNSVAKCAGCDARFVVRDVEWGPVWTPLRWYHRAALRGLQEATQ